ncbi:hypothetical protein F4778DRAFT_786461 [Xylariomycetidae sp. FL2044]|nr:hypothetical protein F4778DRAFT_786461 [Xylariomycetidae sp. FL2044]
MGGINDGLEPARGTFSQHNRRDHFGSAPATSSTIVEPPRPAKPGHEWVWFPAGYWAERVVVETPAKDFMKGFRWRNRTSARESSSPDLEPGRQLSPRYLGDVRTPMPSSGQSFAEAARRPSLQRHGTRSESYTTTYYRMPNPPLPSPYLSEDSLVQSLQGWPSPARRGTSSSNSGNLSKTSRLSRNSPLIVVEEPPSPPNPVPPQSLPLDPEGTPPTDSSQTTLRDTKQKRSLMSKLHLSDPRVQGKKSNQTGNIDHSTSALEKYPSNTTVASSISPLLTGETKKPHRQWAKKLFGMSVWHRKTSGGSEPSATSAMREILRGSSPLSSPNSGHGHSCDSPHAWCSPFPGGEATRVKTPPIHVNTPDLKPRSFFFDINAPANAEAHRSNTSSASLPNHLNGGKPPQRVSSRNHSPFDGDRNRHGGSSPQTNNSAHDSDHLRRQAVSRNRGRQLQSHIQQGHHGDPAHQQQQSSGGGERTDRWPAKEWWEVPVATPSYEKMMSPCAFEFDLPEHLPSSPMCPANKRHKSGGTGVCVYHGRRKKSIGSAATASTTTTAAAAGAGGRDDRNENAKVQKNLGGPGFGTVTGTGTGTGTGRLWDTETTTEGGSVGSDTDFESEQDDLWT